jgi:hypothetical protein
MTSFRILLAAFLLLGLKANSQFLLGYTAGHTGLRELNREIHIYNEINGSALAKEMHPLHWYQGPTIGFRTGDAVFFELTYNRKRVRTESSFDSSGVAMHRQIKVYCNTFNFGFGAMVDGWGFGGSMDFGRFKGFGRRGPEETLKDTPWQRLFVVDNTRLAGISVRLYFAATFWVERRVGIVSVRLFTQPLAFRQPMDGLDRWFFPNRYYLTHMDYAQPNEEHFLNSGISVFLNIGGN